MIRIRFGPCVMYFPVLTGLFLERGTAVAALRRLCRSHALPPVRLRHQSTEIKLTHTSIIPAIPVELVHLCVSLLQILFGEMFIQHKFEIRA